MRTASVAEMKAGFSGYLKSSKKGPVVVTEKGKPVAMLLAIRDEDEIERMLLAYSPKFRSIVDIAEQQILEGKGIRHEDFWKETESEI